MEQPAESQRKEDQIQHSKVYQACQSTKKTSTTSASKNRRQTPTQGTLVSSFRWQTTAASASTACSRSESTLLRRSPTPSIWDILDQIQWHTTRIIRKATLTSWMRAISRSSLTAIMCRTRTSHRCHTRIPTRSWLRTTLTLIQVCSAMLTASILMSHWLFLAITLMLSKELAPTVRAERHRTPTLWTPTLECQTEAQLTTSSIQTTQCLVSN